MPCKGLVNRERKYKFVVILARFHLVSHPWIVPEEFALHLLWRDVVHAHGNLLIFVKAVIVMVLKVCFALCGNYLSHEFHSRIVFPCVFTFPLCFDHHFLHAFGVSNEPHFYYGVSLCGNLHAALLVAHCAYAESHPIFPYNLYHAELVSGRSYLCTFIFRTCVWYAVTCHLVNNIQAHALGTRLQCSECPKRNCHYVSLSQFPHRRHILPSP